MPWIIIPEFQNPQIEGQLGVSRANRSGKLLHYLESDMINITTISVSCQ